jgi:hypothetical protein
MQGRMTEESNPMRAETMSWAGPLPEQFDPVAEQMWNATTPLEGRAGAFRMDAIVWAGPLPPAEVPVRFVFRDQRRQFTARAR